MRVGSQGHAHIIGCENVQAMAGAETAPNALIPPTKYSED